MIDTTALCQSIDLRALIERDAGGTSPLPKGRLWCPFCQGGQAAGNHAPALSVKDNSYYYCFGCGAGGNAISYVMKRNDVDFLRACTILGWRGSVDITTLERSRDAWQARQEEAQRERIALLDQTLAEYSEQEIWEAYHRRMTASHFAWWESQGVPREWQDYLHLGYTPDKAYYVHNDKKLHHSPAFTIPYFHHGFVFKNLQYRLQNPDNPNDRYRFEFGLATVYYMVTPSLPIGEQVVICEGAKKAIVCHVYGDMSDNVTVLAVPSKSSYGGIVEAVKGAQAVWIVLDPDAWVRPKNAAHDWRPEPYKLAAQIGDAARIVTLPTKLDDAFMLYGMTASEWHEARRQAVRL
jgi:hypothetical protein